MIISLREKKSQILTLPWSAVLVSSVSHKCENGDSEELNKSDLGHLNYVLLTPLLKMYGETSL